MSDALLLVRAMVRVDYQFTLHVQVVVRSGPYIGSVFTSCLLKWSHWHCDRGGGSGRYGTPARILEGRKNA